MGAHINSLSSRNSSYVVSNDNLIKHEQIAPASYTMLEYVIISMPPNISLNF